MDAMAPRHRERDRERPDQTMHMHGATSSPTGRDGSSSSARPGMAGLMSLTL